MKRALVRPGVLGAFLAAAAPLPGGCALLARPTARVTGVGLKDIGVQAATLVFDVEVTNPYAVPLPLVDVDYALASGDKPFLSGKGELQGTVPARASRVVSLPARVVYLELLAALTSVRPGSVVPYQVDLGLSVKPPALPPLRLPLKREGELPVPAVPEVSVQEIRWESLTLDSASGRVKLNFVNRNQFAVNLARLVYGLSLGGVEVANSSLASPVAFEAGGGAGTVEIPVSFSPRKAGLAVFRMLSGQGAGYRLAGTAEMQTRFGPMSLPIEKAGSTIFKR